MCFVCGCYVCALRLDNLRFERVWRQLPPFALECRSPLEECAPLFFLFFCTAGTGGGHDRDVRRGGTRGHGKPPALRQCSIDIRITQCKPPPTIIDTIDAGITGVGFYWTRLKIGSRLSHVKPGMCFLAWGPCEPHCTIRRAVDALADELGCSDRRCTASFLGQFSDSDSCRPRCLASPHIAWHCTRSYRRI